ncbi:hypothetical protein [Leucobacter sp. W1478]|uniref:hypothetical protein n=1 Tax=Leucobacter sp. W1478 TaxID=3439065 RepID=UPI003F2BEC7B
MSAHPSPLLGSEPAVGGARVSVEGDQLVWSLDGERIASPQAGTGVAADIVDLVLTGAADPRATEDARAPRERAIPVDQTHTSVIVDERWVVKIVRRWGNADRAAAILRRLNCQAATATAALGGTLEWEHPDFGRSTLAIISEYVPDAVDGWTWAPEEVAAYLRAHADGDRCAEPPPWPRELGELTAQMHLLLVVDAEPRSATNHRRRAHAQARTLFKRVFAEREESNSADQRLYARQQALADSIEGMRAENHPALTVPLVMPHGDYHVGQILKAADGRYVILDFDGDPQWNREQQVQPDGAARDIAHMLVSIDLVASVAQRRLGRVEPLAWEWADLAKQQFLSSYLGGVPTGFLDAALLDGLQAEQLLAEVSYARAYLPPWRYASDGAITHRYQRITDEPEEPWSPPALPTT